jgi:hypothetical protein
MISQRVRASRRVRPPLTFVPVHICTCFIFSAGIFKQSMGARNRVGIGLSYWPARLHMLAEMISWNRFLGSLKFLKFGLRSSSSFTHRLHRKWKFPLSGVRSIMMEKLAQTGRKGGLFYILGGFPGSL